MTSKGEPWSSTSSPPPNVHIHLHGVTFHLNKELMASRSSKLASLLFHSHHQINLSSNSSISIPAGPEIFELAVSFCYGHDPNLSPDTIIPLTCVASYLEMTEDHSPNNLLKTTISFLNGHILPYWNETLRSLQAATPVLHYAQHLGIIDACLNSISEKAVADPSLIGDPVGDSTARTGVKRRLFVVDRVAPEDLTSLTLPLYELAVSALIRSGVPPTNLARCIYRYMKRWIDHRIMSGEDGSAIEMSVFEKSNLREVIEAVERLMPSKRGVIHVSCLFEMLRSAIFLQASKKCREGFEARIGKQLPEASVDDLRIPCNGYTNESKSDLDCINRMLDHFYSNYALVSSEVKTVLCVVENFMAEAAAVDENLSKEVFVAMVEKVATMGKAIGRCQDGIYRAIDMYLDAHGHETEAEREETCKVLDCHRMSGAACEHAAQNERLPLRMVAQALFVGQRRLREVIAGAAMSSEGGSRAGEEEEEKRVVVGGGGGDNDNDVVDDDDDDEMIRMDNRVMELEREHVRMRRDIEKGSRGFSGKGLWKEMKGLLGCKSGPLEFNSCHWTVKNKKQKVHPNKRL